MFDLGKYTNGKLYPLKNIPEEFFNKNTLFHYTNFNNGISILNTNELKTSPRKTSNDPIESIQLKKIIYSYGENFQDLYSRNKIQIKKWESLVSSQLNNVNQVCFCKSNSTEDIGFLKSRMWNQYGDNFNGICLVFDKDMMVKKNHRKILISGDVEYLNFNEIKTDIDYNLNKIFDDNQWSEKIHNRLLKKHIDFNQENEFRILTKKNIENIDVKDSLIGVIFSKTNNSFNPNLPVQLPIFIRRFQKRCVLINWNGDGPEFFLNT